MFCYIVGFTAAGTSAATRTSIAGVVTTQSTPLNVRASASINGAWITTLPKGAVVTLLEKDGNWWHVEYAKGKFGYCSADYITVIADSAAAYVNTESTNLNVRTGPGLMYNVETSLPKGTAFVILIEENGWCHVLYDGTRTGYVSSDYVRRYATVPESGAPSPTQPPATQPPATQPPATQPPAAQQMISLDVPLYLQADSRWGQVKIGTAGGTLRSIGCLVTCLAMAETYRTGTVIYPDAQAASMRFTAGGSAYWPSNYRLYFGGPAQDYLEQIYQLLSEGKPALIGGKTATGGQHWVLVTGYTGTGTGEFRAEDFTIRDPAGVGRTTLDEHWRDYPRIYYMAYYA